MTHHDQRKTTDRTRATAGRLTRVLSPYLLLLASFGAHATCSLVSGTNFPVQHSVPINGTINVPRNAAVGTELATFIYALPKKIEYAYCRTAGTLVVDRGLASTPHLPPVMDRVYPTNVPGVGVKVRYNQSTTSRRGRAPPRMPTPPGG